MKSLPVFIGLPLFMALSQPMLGRSVPLAQGGRFTLPSQTVVGPEGISFVRPGEAKPSTISWNLVDLVQLAKTDAEIEQYRQKALLTGEKTLLASDAPKANPYAEFLSIPVKVVFRPKETHQSKVESSSVITTVPPVDPVTGLPLVSVVTPGQPQRFVNSSTSTRSDTTIDATRRPLDTTIVGFLEIISDRSHSSTGNLLREVREFPDVFTSILAEVRALQSQVAPDPDLNVLFDSLQVLSKNGAVSVDAQDRVRRILPKLKTRSGMR